jgi:hypothetical protein
VLFNIKVEGPKNAYDIVPNSFRKVLNSNKNLPPLLPNANKLFSSLVIPFQQQNKRLKRVEQNQGEIPREIATQLEVAQGNQQNSTLLVIVDVVSVQVKLHRGGGNPPGHSTHMKEVVAAHCLDVAVEILRHHVEVEEILRLTVVVEKARWIFEMDILLNDVALTTVEVRPFARKILDFPILRAFEKPQKLELYDGKIDLVEHVEHINTILNYHMIYEW